MSGKSRKPKKCLEKSKVFPDSVSETGGLLYLNSSNMIPYAIAGIKEMDLKVQELTKENKELKAQKDKEIADLRRRLEALEGKVGK